MLERVMGSLKDRYLFFAILLLAGIIAFPITTTNLWTIVCLAAFIVHDRFNKLAQGVKNNAISKLIVLYFFFIVVTALRESTFADSLAIVVKRILIILPLFFYRLNITADDERRILSAYVLSVTVACVISFFKTLTDLHLITNFYEFSWQLSRHSSISFQLPGSIYCVCHHCNVLLFFQETVVQYIFQCNSLCNLADFYHCIGIAHGLFFHGANWLWILIDSILKKTSAYYLFCFDADGLALVGGNCSLF